MRRFQLVRIRERIMRALRYVDDPLVLVRTDQGWLLRRVSVEASFTQSLDHAGAVDAISQSIVLGANVQLNNLTFTGHDSVVADHGSTAHHDNS